MTGRVFHTSDWHLGRQIGRHRRDTEFDAVFDEIVEIARDFAPDLIVHSGDLFDSRPNFDDVVRAAEVLRRLGDIAPVVVVAGNHDTPYVLTFLDYILNDMGTRRSDQVRVRFATDARPGGLLIAEYPTAAGDLTLRIGALPYLHPNRFAYDFGDPATATAAYAERMRAVQVDVYRRLAASRGPRDALVFAAHLFVEGATPSYSEKQISVSSDCAVAANALPAVDYGALGHIHKPQQVEGAGFPARYAGSPLQLDFGETRDTKSVVLAEISPVEAPRIELVPMTSGRRLVQLTGTLDEITQRAHRVGNAWVKSVVDVDSPVPSLSEALSRLLPQATIVGIVERRSGAISQVLDRETTAADLPGVEDLLRDYLPGRGVTGRELDRVMSTLAYLQHDSDLTDPAPCCEEALLMAALEGHGFDEVDRAGLLIGTESNGSESRK